jgi:hypothetical protein
MKLIEIEWLSDVYDCETCGSDWADGAIVKFDGEVVIDMTPVAHCYDGVSFSQDQVYAAILEKLGHVLVFKGE